MRINITCQTCGEVHDVPRTNEIPDWVISMWCNWCPSCEDRGTEDYEEGYNPDNEDAEPLPLPVPDNQLTMPFIFDELEIPIIEHQIIFNANKRST